jgi:hypothetical protein
MPSVKELVLNSCRPFVHISNICSASVSLERTIYVIEKVSSNIREEAEEAGRWHLTGLRYCENINPSGAKNDGENEDLPVTPVH